jgi:hypothetical protein
MYMCKHKYCTNYFTETNRILLKLDNAESSVLLGKLNFQLHAAGGQVSKVILKKFLIASKTLSAHLGQDSYYSRALTA